MVIKMCPNNLSLYFIILSSPIVNVLLLLITGIISLLVMIANEGFSSRFATTILVVA